MSRLTRPPLSSLAQADFHAGSSTSSRSLHSPLPAASLRTSAGEGYPSPTNAAAGGGLRLPAYNPMIPSATQSSPTHLASASPPHHRPIVSFSTSSHPNPLPSTTSSSLFLRNTTPHDRRLLAKKEAIARTARTRKFGLVGLSIHRRRYFWRSPFVHKDKRVRMLLVHHSSVYPVLSRHLAARMIQHWWHRFTPEQRTKRSAVKKANAQAKGLVWQHPYQHWAQMAQAAFREPRKRTPALAAAYFLETGAYASPLGSNIAASSSGGVATAAGKTYTHGFKDWCAGKIARSWLHWHTARRYRNYNIRPIYIYAAIDIQRCWRESLRKRRERGDPTLHLQDPARTIQRAYKRFTQRRIYQYFRDLILARQNSNPYLLLKLLNPREGTAHDHASGLYLRFRLGGSVFPPILYYKTFTNFAITDIGAFAPRDYARDRKMERDKVHVSDAPTDGTLHSSQLNPTDRAYWYRRYENNGWRPIVDDAILAERDAVCEKTSAVKVTFHPNKLVRRMDALKKRKGKKIEWLKKLYSSGVLTLPTNEELERQRRGEDGSGEEKEFSAGDGGGVDSDEEEWNAWKSASAARLPHLSSSSGGEGRSAEEILRALDRVDTSNPRELLGGDWEHEAADLLQWANGLADFETYSDAWLVQATSRPNDVEYRRREKTETTGEWERTGKLQSAQQQQRDSHQGSSVLAGSGLSQQTSQSNLGRSTQPTSNYNTASQRALDASISAAAAEDDLHRQAEEELRRQIEEDNEGLPDWIKQTASKANLPSLQTAQQQHGSQQASQRSLMAASSQRSVLSSYPSSSASSFRAGGAQQKGSQSSLGVGGGGSQRSLGGVNSSSSIGAGPTIIPAMTVKRASPSLSTAYQLDSTQQNVALPGQQVKITPAAAQQPLAATQKRLSGARLQARG